MSAAPDAKQEELVPSGVISGELPGSLQKEELRFLRSFRKGVLVSSGDCLTKEDGSFELTPNAPLKKGFHQLMIEKRVGPLYSLQELKNLFTSKLMFQGSGYLTGLKSVGLLLLNWLQHTMMSLCPLQDNIIVLVQKTSKRYW